jgi:hypothetical protein
MTVPSTDARDVAATHVDAGIARAGAMVGGTMVAEEDRGGVVVVWVDAAGARGVRFSDHTGEMVAGPATFGPPSDVEPPEPAPTDPHAFLGVEGDLRVVARRGAEIVVYPTVCGP